jgi:hypothetical protein
MGYLPGPGTIVVEGLLKHRINLARRHDSGGKKFAYWLW